MVLGLGGRIRQPVVGELMDNHFRFADLSQGVEGFFFLNCLAGVGENAVAVCLASLEIAEHPVAGGDEADFVDAKGAALAKEVVPGLHVTRPVVLQVKEKDRGGLADFALPGPGGVEKIQGFLAVQGFADGGDVSSCLGIGNRETRFGLPVSQIRGIFQRKGHGGKNERGVLWQARGETRHHCHPTQAQGQFAQKSPPTSIGDGGRANRGGWGFCRHGENG